MKKLYILLLCLFVCVGLTGCSDGNGNANDGSTVYNPFSNSGKSSDDDEEPTNTNSSQIKIEDLNWEVKEGVFNEKRTLLFEYTNNSGYDVKNFSIKFTLPSNVTEDQLTVFDDIKQAENISDAEIRNIVLDAPSTNYDNNLTKNKDVFKASPCHYREIYEGTLTLEQYNLLKPDMAIIEYIDDGKVYTVNYDFKNDNYTQQDIQNAFTWSSSKIANLIPRVDAIVGNVSIDEEKSYSFTGYGVDKDYFNDYVQKCKDAGFNVDQFTLGELYEASNLDGYKLSVSLDNNCNVILIDVNKPE